jgi:ABC-type molybdate transport system ATPase subunit
VCILYSSHTTREAMRWAFAVVRASAGNVPPFDRKVHL